MSEQLLEEKHDSAARILRDLRRVVVAFSAGVDSTLVLKIALDTLGQGNVLAVTGRSASVPQSELGEAAKLAGCLGAEHVLIDTSEFENADYLVNPTNRCYFCKTTLYEHLDRLAGERGFQAIVNGTNADDLGDHRPGLLAASEHGVRSPLAESGFSKGDVRELSRRLGLPTHDKPAGPCLSSRVQYGEEITPEKLRRIEAAESYLKSLGIRECRVRHHHNLARIEISPESFPLCVDAAVAPKIDAYFRSIGYAYVTLDLRGFRSGSMNEVLIEVRRPKSVG